MNGKIFKYVVCMLTMMVLQSSGAISFSQIQNNMGGNNPISLSEYYANATLSYTSGITGIPNTGSQIKVSQFYGKARYVADTNSVTITMNGSAVSPTLVTGTTDTYYYSFTNTSATYKFACAKNVACDVFLIGGGGSGNNQNGGGAGACIVSIGNSLSAGNYTVVVGAGGVGMTNGIGNNGGDSSIGSLFVAKGGGGGGAAGGCAGGTGNYYTTTALNPVATNVVNGVTTGPIVTTSYAVYGNAGGYKNGNWNGYDYNSVNAGSGGGIGTAGGQSTNTTTSPPGNGLYQATINNITYNFKNYFSPATTFGVNDGSGNFYIGGGGSGSAYTSTNTTITLSGGLGGGGISYETPASINGENAVQNTGSGGGGTQNLTPGNGGSGIIIIRFKYPTIDYINKDLYITMNGSDVAPTLITSTTNTFYYSFTNTTATYCFVCGKSTVCDVLLVGGGGGGSAGGGGAGQFRFEQSYTFNPGIYSIIVGVGGTGAIGTNNGGQGGHSRINNGTSDILIAYGGGGGGGNQQVNPTHTSGQVGSFGGSGHDQPSNAGTTTFGNVGGKAANNSSCSGGGGGGAGAAGGISTLVSGLYSQAGTTHPYYRGGQGGDGLQTTIRGTTEYFAGGGSAGANTNNSTDSNPVVAVNGGGGAGALAPNANGTAGIANTGGGGGGGDWERSVGATGGSGIVIIRFKYP